jgi:hypothetical protein
LFANLFLVVFSSFANESDSLSILNSKEYDYIYRYFPNGALASKALIKNGELKGFTDLLPFVSSSPNQKNAGSCHFMALAGNAEFWLAKLNPELSWQPNGLLDLSERYLMNMNEHPEFKEGVENWKTDTIFVLNNIGKGVLNRDYPFTMGWYKKNENYVAALPNEEGAAYGTPFNWIDETEKLSDGFIELPKFSRDILFADPESNQWNVMVAPEDIVETVKNALVKNQAPVTVMYNNIGYWHVVMIVGFDDDVFNDNCYFTSNFENSLETIISVRKEEFEKEVDEKAKTKLLGQIKKLKSTQEKFSDIYKLRGSCTGKGGFYVRDSIYSDPDGVPYDYFTGVPANRENYSRKVIIREYEWLEYLANHIWQIKVDI